MPSVIKLLDVPDKHQLPRDWLFEQNDETLFAHIRLIETYGPAFAGATPLDDRLWRLKVPIGFGRIANLMFIGIMGGNWLALHGFTTAKGQSDEIDIAIAQHRLDELLR